MNDELEALLAQPPYRYHWQEITEFDTVDKRAFLMDELHAGRIGIHEAYLDWRPKNIPPGDDEIIGWLWVIRPDLEAGLLERASETLRNVINRFRESR